MIDMIRKILAWPHVRYKRNQQFKKKLAELKKRDPFDDGDE